MKKVMTFGSFDILHEGHKSYLKEAKSFGDYLIVVVARDSNIEKFKGRKPKHGEDSRLSELKNLEIVNEALLGNSEDIFKVLEEQKPDIIVLGYDQSTATEEKIKEELNKRGLSAEVKRAKSHKPHVYKSSKLRD